MPPKKSKASKVSPKVKVSSKTKRKTENLKNDGNGDQSSSKYFKSEKESSSGSSCKSVDKLEASAKRLTSVFYNQDCPSLAKALLGKKLFRKLPSGEILSCVIVETEAYLGGEDKAAHSYNGKRTNKNEAMYMPPGTSYVYHIYGSYTCVNISSQGDGAAVLIRAMEPLDGFDIMKKFRSAKHTAKSKALKDKDIGNGPSKLTQALKIDKEGINKQDLNIFPDLWLEDGPKEIATSEIVPSARIGVDYAKEWAKKPLRYYIKGNIYISKRDKQAEEEME